MKIPVLKNIPRKYIIIVGVILIAIFVLIAQLISPKKTNIGETVPLATPSATVTLPPANPVEETIQWNREFDQTLQQYEKTDKARVDQSLAVIRLNTPVVQDGFKVDYNYKNATYTFTLKSPAATNKQKALV